MARARRRALVEVAQYAVITVNVYGLVVAVKLLRPMVWPRTSIVRGVDVGRYVPVTS